MHACMHACVCCYAALYDVLNIVFLHVCVFLSLERILTLLEHSDLVFHDYWRVTVVTKEEEGGFSAWCNTAKSVVRLGEDRNGGVRIKSFIMSNYFSIG